MMLDLDYDTLRDILLTNCSIDISYYSRSFVMRRVSARIKMHNLKDYSEYIKMLKSNSREVNELVKELSINVTEFFRDLDVYEHFASIIKGYSGADILSIGCATGEEPYSIAITAREYNIKCRIVAYDVNKNAIEYAKQGCYTIKSLKNMPLHMLKYFDTDGKNYYIKKEVKDMVRFEVKDVTKVDFSKPIYDIIFCRNMLIYFDDNVRNRLIDSICNALKVGGYLIIGKAESILTSNRLECTNIRTKVYRRII